MAGFPASFSIDGAQSNLFRSAESGIEIQRMIRPSLSHTVSRKADARLLVENERLQHVNKFTGEDVGDDVIHGSKVPVGISTAVQGIILASIIQDVGLRFQ